jgi:acyl carrier protein
VAVHHLAFDMVSMALFMREFIPVYDAISSGRPIPAAESTTASLVTESESRPEDLTYWREILRGFTPGGLDLWCGVPRGRRPVTTGGNVRRALSPEAQQAVLDLQRVARAPVAAVLLAAYSALLASHGAGPDIVIGSPVDVRGASSTAIGYHVNVVPLRVRVDFSAGFRVLARQARDAFLGGMAHANVSVDDLTGELPGVGSSWQTALFQHLFNFLPAASLGELSIDGMPARLLTIDNPYSKFDLELVGTPSMSEIWFRYSRDILARADVEAMLRRFEALLIAAAQDADRPIGEMAGWSDLDRKIIDQANRTGGWVASEWMDDPDGLIGGRPVADTRAFIAAPDGRELPVGLRGELCLAGTGFAPSDSDDARFAHNERYGRYYRTGEVARWRFDGTIERLARPAGDAVDVRPDEPDPAADDQLVQDLIGVWRELLNTEATAHTSFFEAGGHSLLAAVLAQKVEDMTGASIPLTEIFENPTPAALAARARENRARRLASS